MAKIQKSLDYNKLIEQQRNGKMLKKHLRFPLWAEIKYDGNYTVVKKEVNGLLTFTTSGGHIYDNDQPTIFHKDKTLPVGVYICERIGIHGKLGDRVNCALRGPKGNQTAHGHKYIVHDFISLPDYEEGIGFRYFLARREFIESNLDASNIAEGKMIVCIEELEAYLKEVVSQGYEGLMLKDLDWYWKDTKSRTIDCAKYKKRRTADLMCVGTEEGTGKYEGMIGSLILEDSTGRQVSVGSGLSDEDRGYRPSYFIGAVVEIEYEQIIETYIQPTFIQTRDDKAAEEID